MPWRFSEAKSLEAHMADINETGRSKEREKWPTNADAALGVKL